LLFHLTLPSFLIEFGFKMLVALVPAKLLCLHFTSPTTKQHRLRFFLLAQWKALLEENPATYS